MLIFTFLFYLWRIAHIKFFFTLPRALFRIKFFKAYLFFVLVNSGLSHIFKYHLLTATTKAQVFGFLVSLIIAGLQIAQIVLLYHFVIIS